MQKRVLARNFPNCLNVSVGFTSFWAWQTQGARRACEMRSSGIENGQKTTNNEYQLSLHRFSSNIKFKFKIILRLYGLFLQARFFDLSCKDGI